MAEKPEKRKGSKEFSRREFLKDAGLVVAGAAMGSIALAGACTTTTTTTENVTTTVTLPPITKQGETTTLPASTVTNTATTTTTVTYAKAKTKISVYPERCIGCEVCVLACSSCHEGATSRTLSRIRNDIDPLSPNLFEPKVCKQCDNPPCIPACPLGAIYIDANTGARCVDAKKCIGCGFCVTACPFDPPRISIDQTRKLAIKCDLCKDRASGPACAEFCQTQALMLVGVGAEKDIYAP